MPTDVIMPQMGESIFEGTITKWLKKPGDTVQRDEPLFEISTDKVDAEIPSPAAGVLKEIKVAEGATVQVNTVVGVIDAAGASTGAAAPAAQAQAAAAKESAQKIAATTVDTTSVGGEAVRETPTPSAPKSAPPAAGNGGGAAEHIRSSPLVRRIAKDHGVDLAQLPPGSGAGGRINKDDILNFISQQGQGGAPAKAPTAAPAVSMAPVAPGAGIAVPGDIVPMSKMRAIIAQRMVESKHTSAHVHT